MDVMNISNNPLIRKVSFSVQYIDLRHILIVTFLLRVLFYIIVYNNLAHEYGWTADDNYDEIALNVISGNGYRIHATDPPNTVRPPLYTLFLIVIFSILGPGKWKVFLVQDAMQVIICYYIYKLARRMTHDTSTAKIASILFAIYPQSMLYNSMFITETLFALLILMASHFFLDLINANNRKSAVCLGIFLGLSALTRPISLLLIVPLVLIYVKRGDDVKLRSRIANSIIMVTIFISTIFPWSVRNYLCTGKIIPVSSRGGHFLYSNTIADKNEEKADQIREFGVADNSDPEKRDYTYIKLAIQNILEKPGLFVSNTIKTVLDFWYRGHSRRISIFNAFVNFSLLILAVIGIILLRYHAGYFYAPFIVIILYFNLCYGFLHAISRYSFPIMPFVMMYASYFIASIIKDTKHASA